MADQVLWQAPDGSVLDLTDESAGFRVLAAGTRGLRSPEYELQTAKYAGIDGETLQAVRASANEPTLGLLVQADDEDTFRSRARGLVRAMRPKAGLGTLTVRSVSGDVRSLSCLCVGGLEGDEDQGSTLPGAWWRLVLKFFAPDPWWVGTPIPVDLSLGAPTAFFPILPVKLSSSSVQGQFTVDLSHADAPTYPVWTITGPGTGLTLTNLTTGRVITVSASLSVGQTLVIDTRPGFQSVRRGDGTNLMSAVTSDPALWPLMEGVNNVSAVLSGATAASRISGLFIPRFAGI